MSVDIILASDADQDRVFDYVIKHFYPEEPLASAVGRKPQKKEDSPSIAFLRQNLTLLAVEKENPEVICGICLNQEDTLNDESNMWKDVEKENPTDTPYGKVIKFLNINKKLFLEGFQKKWPRSMGEKCLDVCILSIRNANRQQGLAQKLLERSMELARERQYKFVTIECSSAYSAIIAEKLGFTQVHQLLYTDYKDEEGQVVFNTQSPHRALKSYAKEI